MFWPSKKPVEAVSVNERLEACAYFFTELVGSESNRGQKLLNLITDALRKELDNRISCTLKCCLNPDSKSYDVELTLSHYFREETRRRTLTITEVDDLIAKLEAEHGDL